MISVFRNVDGVLTFIARSVSPLEDVEAKYPSDVCIEGQAFDGDTLVAGVISSPEPTEEDIAHATEDLRYALWFSASEYEKSFIQGSATAMVAVNAAAGKPKATAVKMWAHGLWGEYYTRLEDLDNASDDFSNMGDIPHSVIELVAEDLADE